MGGILSQVWALFVIAVFLFLVFAVPITIFYYVSKIADEKRLSVRDLFILTTTVAIVCLYVYFAIKNNSSGVH